VLARVLEGGRVPAGCCCIVVHGGGELGSADGGPSRRQGGCVHGSTRAGRRGELAARHFTARTWSGGNNRDDSCCPDAGPGHGMKRAGHGRVFNRARAG